MHHWKNLSFLSSFALRVVFVKGSKIAVFVIIVTSERARWPPLFITFLSYSWLVTSVYQVSSTIYLRFFYCGITLRICLLILLLWVVCLQVINTNYIGAPPYDDLVITAIFFQSKRKTLGHFNYLFWRPGTCNHLVITTRILWPNWGRINGICYAAKWSNWCKM